MIRKEVRQLQSRYLDGTLMYPGKWLLTWIKSPFMPWVLVEMVQTS
jgi:hypothetical protein